MKRTGNLLLLDAGSKQIRSAVISYDNEDPFNVIYLGEHPSVGFNCGAVSDMKLASESIRAAITSSLSDAGIKKFHRIWMGHSGAHIRSENITEIHALTSNRIVTPSLEKKIYQRSCKHVPAHHYLLHNFLRSRSLDGIPRKQMIGLSGNRLVYKYHLVYTRLNVLNNIQETFKQAGYHLDRLVFNGHAASMGVVDNDEKYTGCLVIHMGSATCDYIVYQEGSPFLCGSINEGWERVAKDVAIGVQIPLEKAEALMTSDGSTSEIFIGEDQKLPVKTFFGAESRLTRRHLAKIMGCAVDEILCTIRDNIKDTICRGHLPAGVIFTGGGAHTNGLIYTAENVFGVPARPGDPVLPGDSREFTPAWSPVVGMLMTAAQEFKPEFKPEKALEYCLHPFRATWGRMFPVKDASQQPSEESVEWQSS